jgi:hypothetical protein
MDDFDHGVCMSRNTTQIAAGAFVVVMSIVCIRRKSVDERPILFGHDSTPFHGRTSE